MKNDRDRLGRGAGALEVVIAREPRDVDAAQRLRHRVFGEELGAVLPTAASGRDEDPFDRFCDHLLVRDGTSGTVVGTGVAAVRDEVAEEEPAGERHRRAREAGRRDRRASRPAA